jgi:hypothetical protein
MLCGARTSKNTSCARPVKNKDECCGIKSHQNQTRDKTVYNIRTEVVLFGRRTDESWIGYLRIHELTYEAMYYKLTRLLRNHVNDDEINMSIYRYENNAIFGLDMVRLDEDPVTIRVSDIATSFVEEENLLENVTYDDLRTRLRQKNFRRGTYTPNLPP